MKSLEYEKDGIIDKVHLAFSRGARSTKGLCSGHNESRERVID